MQGWGVIDIKKVYYRLIILKVTIYLLTLLSEEGNLIHDITCSLLQMT